MCNFSDLLSYEEEDETHHLIENRDCRQKVVGNIRQDHRNRRGDGHSPSCEHAGRHLQKHNIKVLINTIHNETSSAFSITFISFNQK